MKGSKKQPSEFTVTVEGVDLPEHVVAAINDAIQRAALAEVAKLDLRGSELVFRPIMAQMLSDPTGGGGGGGTGGGGGGAGGGGGGGAHVIVRRQ
jgi:hypothetical protein